MSKEKNKREWIKTAAIVFLSIMLVLTFFSNTIMNYSLPVVATDYVQNGSITAKIRGTGMVEGTDPYVVKLAEDEAAKVISSIEIRKGEHVDEGQVLMKFSTKKVVGMEEAQKNLKAAQDAYNAVVKELESAVLKGQLTNEKKNQLLKGVTGQYQDYLEAITSIDTQVEELEKNLSDYETALAQCNFYLTLNSGDALIDKDAALAEKTAAEKEFNAANGIYVATKNQIADLEEKLKTAEAGEEKDSMEATLKEKKEALPALEKEATSKKAVFDQKNAYYNKPIEYENQQSLKTQYEYLIDVTRQNLTAAKENKDAINSTVDNENMYYEKVKLAKDTLAEAKKNVSDLEGAGDTSEILAPISGIVDELFFKSGEEVSAGQIVANIQPDGKGYTMSISVTNEQARNVSVGDRADLVNSWYYYDTDVVLSSIKPDRSDPGKKKMLTFDVTGDVTTGQSLTISVGQRSANYDLIVPNSAIHEDSNGKFILIIESKSSPLGNRYIATRVDVQVVASDDTKSAISGALNGWEYVITTSNKPVEANKQVRLADN